MYGIIWDYLEELDLATCGISEFVKVGEIRLCL